MFALVDYDVDGIGIMSTYKYGSISLAHESNAIVPTMEWLGVRSRDFIRVNKYKKRQEKDLSGLLQLSARDRRLATKMLEREQILGETGTELEWRQELQIMLMLNVKAEIQILEAGSNFEKWLDAKLRAGRAASKRKIDGRS
jgi:meiotic recombination protein SPO11